MLVSPLTEIDLSTADAFEADLVAARRARPSTVIVEFAGVAFCDSSAVRHLLSAVARAEEADCTVVILNPGKFLCRVADVLGATDRLGWANATASTAQVS